MMTQPAPTRSTAPMQRAAQVACALAMLVLAACSKVDPDAPPDLAYGQDICAQCSMIVSDERFACALIVQQDDGAFATLAFDDIGDMAQYEARKPALPIHKRWVHDYDTGAWLLAQDAYFTRSTNLQTPMGSGVAAHASRDESAAFARKHATNGKVMRWSDLVDAGR